MKNFVKQQKLTSTQGIDGSPAPEREARRSLLPDTLSPQALAAVENSFGSKVCARTL